MGWVIPNAKKTRKKAADSQNEEDPKTTPKTKTKKRPGAKERARGKAHGVAEAKGGDSRTNPVQDTPGTRVTGFVEEGEDEAEIREAAERPKGRAPYVGSPVREEDGIAQGPYQTSHGRPAEAEGRPEKKKGKGERKKKTREGGRTQEEEEGGGWEGIQATEGGRNSGGGNGWEGTGSTALPTNSLQNGPEKHAQAVGRDEPVTSVSVAMQQRRPLPILGNLNVDQAAEARKVRSLPQYACSTCQIGPECPEFQEGYVCAFQEAFAAFPVRDADAVISLMGEIVDTNKARWRMALVNERISSGGMADPNVTRLSEVVMSQASSLVELQQEVSKVTVTVAGPRDEAPKAAGGILSRLFGGSAPPEALPAKPIVVEMNQSSLAEPSRADDERAVMAGGPPRADQAPGPTGSNEGEAVAEGLGLEKKPGEQDASYGLNPKEVTEVTSEQEGAK